MAGQRPPTGAQASWEYNNNEGQHPSDDLLLASVRRQHLDNWIEIEQHVATCPFCREKCLAFQQSSGLISAWVQDKEQQLYPSVANLVTQRIALESRLSPRERILGHLHQAYQYSLLEAVVQRIMGQEEEQSKNQAAGIHVSPLSPLADEPLPGPFAALQTNSLPRSELRPGKTSSQRVRSLKKPALALIVVSALLTLIIGAVASPGIFSKTESNLEAKVITVPHQNSTSTPVKRESSPTPTLSTPAAPGTQISFCNSQSQVKHNILHICGSGFTPNGRVWLSVYGSQSTLLSKSASADGRVDITFTFNSCRAVSILIIVVDDSSHKVATIATITSGSCFSRHHGG